MGDEDTAESGRHHEGRRLVEERPQALSQGRPEGGGQGGIHQDTRALEVARGVKPGREKEVTLEEGSPLTEDLLQTAASLEVVVAHGR